MGLGLQAQSPVPTFESLTKNRILCETRFFINNSSSKWISVGILPTTELLDETAPPFLAEVFLCGDKGSPLPLGGIEGAAQLFNIIRNMPQFAPMYTNQKSNYNGPIGVNIVLSRANFGNEVTSILSTINNMLIFYSNDCTLYFRSIKS